jgi:hypothetical protein
MKILAKNLLLKETNCEGLWPDISRRVGIYFVDSIN